MLWRLFVADLKMIVRNKQSLFWALVFPIIFASVFGIFRLDDIGDADVALFGEPRAVAPFTAAFEELDRAAGPKEDDAPLVLTEEYATGDAARAALEDGELDFILSVRPNGDTILEFNATEADRNAVFQPMIERIIVELNFRLADVEPRYRLETREISGVSVGYYDFVLPGIVCMAVMTYGIIGLGSTLAQYRGQRILRRILATPLKPWMFIVPIVLAHLVLALVQSAIVLAWGVFLFDGSVRGSLISLAVFVILGNLIFLNIGFMVASRVDTAEAASGMGNAIAMPMMFLAGVFFPTGGLPVFMKAITVALPLRPMVDAVREISVRGSSITAFGPQLAQLGAWAVVTFFVASRVFRFDRA